MNSLKNSDSIVFISLGMLLLGVVNLPAQSSPPNITAQPISQTVLAGSNASFSVSVGGTGPFIYQWQFNGTNLVNNLITTVAGGGVGDGGLATNATLSNPSGIAVDGIGDLFIADQANNRVREVGTNGIITTVAGNGKAGFSGDGGLAITGSLVPSGAAVDGSGNLFIADSGNNCIRKVGTNGIIATVAGNGAANYSGDNGAATNASLNGPSGVAVDASGNFFIADSGNSRIRKVSTNGIIVTVAGNGTAGYSGDSGAATNASLNGPSGVVFDSIGNLFISDAANNCIRKVCTNGIIVTVAGNGIGGYSGDGGSATNANLSNPLAAALDGRGNLFIADQNNSRIRKVDGNGLITTVAGGGLGDGGPATSASLNPSDVAVDALGNLFIADAGNNRIRKVGTNGIITTVAGNGTPGYSGDGALATNASLNNPSGLAVDVSANVFIGDSGNNRIRKVGTNGLITTSAGNGTRGHSGDGGAAGNATLNAPVGVALDRLGNLFIADQNNSRIRKVALNNIISTVAGNGTMGYSGDGGAATNATLRDPDRVAADGSGNLFIADEFNFRIRKVSTNGTITTVAGGGALFPGDGGAATNASLSDPSGSAVDGSGNLFIADGGNNVIRMVSTNGIITTVAGNGLMGYSGDGGAATNAALNGPSGAALNGAGNFFFADSKNGCVREVLLGGSPTLTLNGVSIPSAGNYRVIVTSSYGSVTSAVATLTVTQPPAITSSPQSLIVPTGTPASFNVSASGTPPLFFRWQKDGTNLLDAGEISGSTTTNLLLNPATVNDVGGYRLVVTNAWGAATSSVAQLTLALIAITGQPASQFALNGITVTLSVVVSGVGPFTYQWKLNGTNLPNNILTISTVAGLGVSGNNPGTDMSLNGPADIAVDRSGNLFIADSGNNRIRRIGSDGITTVAGNAVQGYSGDGGAATNASLDYPAGVAVDSMGNLYIADEGNNRIRKVSTNGIIITVSGNGNAAYSGDGGMATNASLYNPSGVAVDAIGNLFIADSWNYCVRKVGTNGIISTVAGNGTAGHFTSGILATNAQLGFPQAVAVNKAGNLFIADSANDLIGAVGTNGILTIVAGDGDEGYSGDGGAATNASLDGPAGLVLDSMGNLFVADSWNNCVRKVDTNGVITTFAGNSIGGYFGDGGPASSAWLYFPLGVALDASGNLFIADYENDRVREVGYGGSPTLMLTNVSARDAGNYTVVVTNLYGSVTSQVATLVVGVAPSITALKKTANSIAFSFPTVVGKTIIVQTSTSLSSPVWVAEFTLLGDGQVKSVTLPLPSMQQAYFRLLVQ